MNIWRFINILHLKDSKFSRVLFCAALVPIGWSRRSCRVDLYLLSDPLRQLVVNSLRDMVVAPNFGQASVTINMKQLFVVVVQIIYL